MGSRGKRCSFRQQVFDEPCCVLQITPLVERLSPVQLVHGIIDNVKGFAVEKYGLPPDFEVTHSGDMNGIQVVSQPALVEYVLLEVRSNCSRCM